MSTIVLGYDGSPSANAALAKTIELAPALGSSVVVVFGFYISPLAGRRRARLQGRLETLGEHEVGRARRRSRPNGVEASSRVVSARPADAILAVAEEVGADLIVVGTVGESPISGALLGSVVLKLVQRSPLPMLIVPAPA